MSPRAFLSGAITEVYPDIETGALRDVKTGEAALVLFRRSQRSSKLGCVIRRKAILTFQGRHTADLLTQRLHIVNNGRTLE